MAKGRLEPRSPEFQVREVWEANMRMTIVTSTCLSTFQTPGGSHGPDCPPIPANHHMPGSWRDGCVALQSRHPSGTRQACPGAFFPFSHFPMMKLCPGIPVEAQNFLQQPHLSHPCLRHSDPRSSDKWTVSFGYLPRPGVPSPCPHDCLISCMCDLLPARALPIQGTTYT